MNRSDDSVTVQVGSSRDESGTTSSVIRSFDAGCAFRQTTYRASDYASPSGAFGVPLNHPRFL